MNIGIIVAIVFVFGLLVLLVGGMIHDWTHVPKGDGGDDYPDI